jgi:hypothetical protein
MRTSAHTSSKAFNGDEGVDGTDGGTPLEVTGGEGEDTVVDGMHESRHGNGSRHFTSYTPEKADLSDDEDGDKPIAGSDLSPSSHRSRRKSTLGNAQKRQHIHDYVECTEVGVQTDDDLAAFCADFTGSVQGELDTLDAVVRVMPSSQLQSGIQVPSEGSTDIDGASSIATTTDVTLVAPLGDSNIADAVEAQQPPSGTLSPRMENQILRGKIQLLVSQEKSILSTLEARLHDLDDARSKLLKLKSSIAQGKGQ